MAKLQQVGNIRSYTSSYNYSTGIHTVIIIGTRSDQQLHHSESEPSYSISHKYNTIKVLAINRSCVSDLAFIIHHKQLIEGTCNVQTRINYIIYLHVHGHKYIMFVEQGSDLLQLTVHLFTQQKPLLCEPCYVSKRPARQLYARVLLATTQLLPKVMNTIRSCDTIMKILP